MTKSPLSTATAGTIAVSMMVASLQSSAVATDTSQLHDEAFSKTQQLASQLKSTLMQTVKSAGLEQGVSVCKDAAPAIAKQLSTDGWQVGRTALRVRNPDNKADAWEAEQMRAFSVALANGVKPNKLSAQTYSADTGEYRFMRPIITGKLCINCHGQDINPELQNHIKATYPKDQATGFAVGELRGAFTVTYQPQH